jgi:hypothetical protein
MDKSSKLEGVTANVGAPSVEDQINAIGLGRFHAPSNAQRRILMLCPSAAFIFLAHWFFVS